MGGDCYRANLTRDLSPEQTLRCRYLKEMGDLFSCPIADVLKVVFSLSSAQHPMNQFCYRAWRSGQRMVLVVPKNGGENAAIPVWIIIGRQLASTTQYVGR